jgi:MoxR-like ATPase
VFRHRIALEAEAELEGVRVDQVIDRILATVAVPH